MSTIHDNGRDGEAMRTPTPQPKRVFTFRPAEGGEALVIESWTIRGAYALVAQHLGRNAKSVHANSVGVDVWDGNEHLGVLWENGDVDYAGALRENGNREDNEPEDRGAYLRPEEER